MVRFQNFLSAGLLLLLAIGCQRSESPTADPTAPEANLALTSILKVSALANGEILLNGQPSSLDQLTARLSIAQKIQGKVFYYRETAEQEPHPNAMQAVERIIESKLPVSFSTKPDFSDYVDENGQSHPR
jgi:hypothetical protein